MMQPEKRVRCQIRHVHGFWTYAKLIDEATREVVAQTPDRRYNHTWTVQKDALLLAAERGWILLPEYES